MPYHSEFLNHRFIHPQLHPWIAFCNSHFCFLPKIVMFVAKTFCSRCCSILVSHTSFKMCIGTILHQAILLSDTWCYCGFWNFYRRFFFPCFFIATSIFCSACLSAHLSVVRSTLSIAHGSLLSSSRTDTPPEPNARETKSSEYIPPEEKRRRQKEKRERERAAQSNRQPGSSSVPSLGRESSQSFSSSISSSSSSFAALESESGVDHANLPFFSEIHLAIAEMLRTGARFGGCSLDMGQNRTSFFFMNICIVSIFHGFLWCTLWEYCCLSSYIGCDAVPLRAMKDASNSFSYKPWPFLRSPVSVVPQSLTHVESYDLSQSPEKKWIAAYLSKCIDELGSMDIDFFLPDPFGSFHQNPSSLLPLHSIESYCNSLLPLDPLSFLRHLLLLVYELIPHHLPDFFTVLGWSLLVGWFESGRGWDPVVQIFSSTWVSIVFIVS